MQGLRPPRHPARPLLLGLLAFVALPAAAQTPAVQSLPAIREAVSGFLSREVAKSGEKIQVDAGQLDPRLRLSACPTPLSLTMPPGARTRGATTVAVNCPGPSPWTLFVPAIIRQEFVVISAAQNLDRGKTLTVTDLRLEKRLLTEPPPGAIQETESLLGQVTQRALAAGTVFTRSIVKPRQIVRRGQAVTLSLATGSIAIEVTGTALQAGGIGDRISVRNNNSKKVIEGTIQPSGEVVVDGGGAASLP